MQIDCHIYGSYRRGGGDNTSQEGAKKKTKGLGCHGDKRWERVRTKGMSLSQMLLRSQVHKDWNDCWVYSMVGVGPL